MEQPNVEEKADLEDVAKKVIETILQKEDKVPLKREPGIDFKINVDNQNILHRLKLKRKTRELIIPSICMGSLERISLIIMGMKFHDIETVEEKREGMNYLECFEIAVKNMDKTNVSALSKIVAIAITNKDPKHPNPLIRLFNKIKEKRLEYFLKWNLSPDELYKVFTGTIQKMGVNSFLGLMVSIKGVNLMETKNSPTNGDSSEVVSNTSKEASTEGSSSGSGAGPTS